MANRHRCPADHSHANAGTCYVHHKCRCLPCRTANAARATAYRTGTAESFYAPVAPVRRHIRKLNRFGMGPKAIAAAAGVHSSTVWGITTGASSKVVHDTARRILAVTATPDNVLPSAAFTGPGTRRRLEALQRAGWTIPAIAERTGITASGLYVAAKADRVNAATWRAVADQYEQMLATEPPTPSPNRAAAVIRCRARARAAGYAPAAAWDDIDTDRAPKGLIRDKAAA